MGIESKVKKGKLWAKRKDKEKDPIEFLRENYGSDITRSKLAIVDSALYKVFWRRDLLDEAIPNFDVMASERLRSIITLNRFGGNALKYYKKHYRGKTRGEIRRLDQYLYERLTLEGSLEKVPTKKWNKH